MMGEKEQELQYGTVTAISVMAELVPAIHVFLSRKPRRGCPAQGETKTWMPGTRPGKTSS
ncbi:hypothetical protein [Bradyrhizobium uaiense]|uniref:hypothetical protein n=1 Tax=Bradyrhizobium uaiense TaxID=2594946 RepID=UPI0013D1DA59|nr:hypothetical protein [Bradyrhizobium uaiense]